MKKARVSPGFSSAGGAEGIRTPDLVTASHARSQLRHSPRLSKERESFLDPGPRKVKGNWAREALTRRPPWARVAGTPARGSASDRRPEARAHPPASEGVNGSAADGGSRMAKSVIVYSATG